MFSHLQRQYTHQMQGRGVFWLEIQHFAVGAFGFRQATLLMKGQGLLQAIVDLGLIHALERQSVG